MYIPANQVNRKGESGNSFPDKFIEIWVEISDTNSEKEELVSIAQMKPNEFYMLMTARIILNLMSSTTKKFYSTIMLRKGVS